MIPQVTHLDGHPARSVQQGELYLVPTVYSIPVICPSHVDEGTDGKTGKHWHTDDRFGNVGRSMKFWHQTVIDEHSMKPSDEIKTSIVKDRGESIIMERMTATKSEMWPSGSVFSSVCWLYHVLGTKSAKDGHCVHHHTSLVEQDGCLECPAHGLKYTLDGKPKYKAPFYLSTRYIDWDNKIHRVKELVSFEKDGVVFYVKGRLDPFPMIALEDDNGDVIMDCKSDVKMTKTPKGMSHTLTLNLGAWPSSGACPQLAPSDPRNPKGT